MKREIESKLQSGRVCMMDARIGRICDLPQVADCIFPSFSVVTLANVAHGSWINSLYLIKVIKKRAGQWSDINSTEKLLQLDRKLNSNIKTVVELDAEVFNIFQFDYRFNLSWDFCINSTLTRLVCWMFIITSSLRSRCDDAMSISLTRFWDSLHLRK